MWYLVSSDSEVLKFTARTLEHESDNLVEFSSNAPFAEQSGLTKASQNPAINNVQFHQETTAVNDALGDLVNAKGTLLVAPLTV